LKLNSFLSIFLFAQQKNKYNMSNSDFFKTLDEALKEQVTEALNLDPQKEKAIILREIAKYACQILQYRGVIYQLQLPEEGEEIRMNYFTGIENILTILYKDFNTVSKREKVKIYLRSLPSPKSTVEKNAALKKVQENLGLLKTQWLEYYK